MTAIEQLGEALPANAEEILDSEKQKPTVKFYFYPAGATVKFYFLRKSDAHLYRLVRELTPR